MKLICSISVAIVVVFTCCVAPATEVYKWVDEKGKVHFGDKPPSDNQGSERVEIKQVEEVEKRVNQAPSAAQRLERQKRLLDSYATEREEKKQAAQKEKEEREKQQRRCVRAKHQLKRYKSAGYLYDLDKDGNRVVYSDEKRAKKTQDMERAVQKNCRY